MNATLTPDERQRIKDRAEKAFWPDDRETVLKLLAALEAAEREIVGLHARDAERDAKWKQCERERDESDSVIASSVPLQWRWGTTAERKHDLDDWSNKALARHTTKQSRQQATRGDGE